MPVLLRAARHQQRMTLEELAERTGLTKSYLSKVERGLSTPSIAVALKIAGALGVDVARLFDPESGDELVCVVRAADRTTARPDHGGTYYALATSMLGKRMSPFVVVPSAEFGDGSMREHSGQEFLFVHKGRVELELPGKVESLDVGDCVYFDAAVPHRLRSVGETPAEVLVVAHDDR
ncbi:helix-turn-helix domain-containing protein [Segniliparus rugosus]|uniref:HTH cro/C1-type domain-containing protein n=1 Tax=Segniliparus rugosus (strain ATCC BAA-974 / DSM 45345 / CCUG 50838 / CIP 108380 / JCM 13579 / CDC 945) TaxID=679197 RepID=E5XSN4_SEGRC|nr:XRE family transcriptional regulator [Segniliparus rugosus]EFV12644.1 hypothetical protein HMPREF9336_02506 [Segniliparus rugosus ATCC BAA-974]